MVGYISFYWTFSVQHAKKVHGLSRPCALPAGPCGGQHEMMIILYNKASHLWKSQPIRVTFIIYYNEVIYISYIKEEVIYVLR